jgi:hypothetical protein
MSVNTDRLALINSGMTCDLCGQTLDRVRRKGHRVVVGGTVIPRHIECPEGEDVFLVGQRVRLASTFVYGGTPDPGLVAVGTSGEVRRAFDNGTYLVRWGDSGRRFYVDGTCLAGEFAINQRVRLARPHTYQGREFTHEARVGDTGTITRGHHHDGSWSVTWDRPRRVTTSSVDAVCLEPVGGPNEVGEFTGGTRVRLAQPMTVDGVPTSVQRVGDEGVITNERHESARYPMVVEVEWGQRRGSTRRWWTDRVCLEVVPERPRQRRIELIFDEGTGEAIFQREHHSRTQRRDSRGRFARRPRVGDRVRDSRYGWMDGGGTVTSVGYDTAAVEWDAGHRTDATPFGWLEVLR